MKEKKLEVATREFGTRIPTSSSEKSAVFNHWAMQPLRQYELRINSLEVSFLLFTLLNLMELYLS